MIFHRLIYSLKKGAVQLPTSSYSLLLRTLWILPFAPNAAEKIFGAELISAADFCFPPAFAQFIIKEED
jgi:hypothetical protein